MKTAYRIRLLNEGSQKSHRHGTPRVWASVGLCFLAMMLMPVGVRAQFIPATQAFNNSPVCSDGDLSNNDDEDRANPEWKPVNGLMIDPTNPVLMDKPTILEGFVPFPPANESVQSQAFSEVSEEDIPWNHYTHDFTIQVAPDGRYQNLLSSWVRFPGVTIPSLPEPFCSSLGGSFDGTNCVVPPEVCPDLTTGDTCHYTSMEVEWDNASLMDEGEGFQRIWGAIPEFAWPTVGDRVWAEGRWIFDCGHPGVPKAVPSDTFVKYSTEIHPPRAVVAFRLNHPALDSMPFPRTSAPNFPGQQSWLPVTGSPTVLPAGPTNVPLTEADIFVSGNGGGANDLCMILALSGSNCVFGHTNPVVPVNDRNYAFDIYPPGTDYSHPLSNGTFPVTPPVQDASLQWRIVDHSSELPSHACGGQDTSNCVTVNPLFCLIDSSTPPTDTDPDNADTACPPVPAHPTRLRVILPFKGSDANYFAQSILLGWDDVPVLGNTLTVRNFQVTLHAFTVENNGESFLHDGDWRVFVNVGGQYRYISHLWDGGPFFGSSGNPCQGDDLTDNGNNDCFRYDNTPWTISVQDGTPIHVAVGGFESDPVDSHFCRQFPAITDCNPFNFGDLVDLAFENDDRIGTFEFDLQDFNNYQWVAPDGTPLTSFTTARTSDGENYKVEFRVAEIPRPTPPNVGPLTIGAPNFVGPLGTYISSATPLIVQSSDPTTEGFQYRFHIQGGPLPTYPSVLPFPVHWTHADLPTSSQSVGIQLTGTGLVDGPYDFQYSADSFANLLGPRNAQTVVLDNTPPVITINQPTATQYTHADTLTIAFDVNDGTGSGVKSATPKMDGSTTLPGGIVVANNLKIDLFSALSLGTHTFSVNALDNVNNASTQSVTFSIVVTPNSLEQDVNLLLGFGCVDNSGIGNSLISKIEDVKSRVAAGDLHSAINTLSALLSQAQAQVGKHISSACTDPNTNTQFNPAQVLIGDIEYLLASLKTTGISDPILGYVFNAGGSGVGGAMVTLLDATNTAIASSTTDGTGFYFFAQTGSLILGANYTVQVSGIPKPYSTSTPASQAFPWPAAQVSLSGFLLN